MVKCIYFRTQNPLSQGRLDPGSPLKHSKEVCQAMICTEFQASEHTCSCFKEKRFLNIFFCVFVWFKRRTPGVGVAGPF